MTNAEVHEAVDSSSLVDCPTSDPECARCMRVRLEEDLKARGGSWGQLAHLGIAGALAFAASAGVGGEWTPFITFWAIMIAVVSAAEFAGGIIQFVMASRRRGRTVLACQFDRQNGRIGAAKSIMLRSGGVLSAMVISSAMAAPQ